MATMRALVKSRPEPGIWMEDVPIPEPGINDVLIKIHKSAICGTDIHIYDWDAWSQNHIKTPLVVGHEFAGTVAAVGSNVHDFHEGDIVSGEGHLVCGVCRNCLAGRRHLCARTAGVGIDRPGSYAEYLCIPQTNVWYADQTIPMELLAFFDPFGNAAHTALSFNIIGEDVLITGCGPIGCMAAAICKHVGARYIVATDINPFRLDLAKKMGATHVVDVRTEKLADVQKELGMKEGFDVGLEMSGSPAALRDMLANMCHGGKVALLGIQPPGTDIDWDLVIFSSLIIKGIYGREMYETWYKMQAMLQSGLDITAALTHKFPIDDFQKGFEIMKSGESGKVVLEWV